MRRGAGRARIAVIRKLCSIMRRMLMDNKPFGTIQIELFQKKLHQYEKELKKAQ